MSLILNSFSEFLFRQRKKNSYKVDVCDIFQVCIDCKLLFVMLPPFFNSKVLSCIVSFVDESMVVFCILLDSCDTVHDDDVSQPKTFTI